MTLPFMLLISLRTCLALQYNDLPRLLRDYALPAWQKNAEISSQLHGQIISNKRTSQGVIEGRELYVRKFNGCRLVHVKPSLEVVNKKARAEELFGSNSRYHFLLKRVSGTWVLSKIEKNQGGVLPREWRVAFETADFGITQAFYVHHIPLHEFFNDPKTVITSIEELNFPDVSAKKSIKINFRCKPPQHEFVPELVQGGWIIVDQEEWLVHQCEYDIEFKGGIGTGTKFISFHDYYDAGGIKVPRVTRMKQNNKTSKGVQVTIDVEGVQDLSTSSRSLSTSDFTLTAFGLPEPYGIEWERPTPWGWYILGGTLGMVFVMGIVWRIRRWRAAA